MGVSLGRKLRKCAIDPVPIESIGIVPALNLPFLVIEFLEQLLLILTRHPVTDRRISPAIRHKRIGAPAILRRRGTLAGNTSRIGLARRDRKIRLYSQVMYPVVTKSYS
jgi:hypothetical protein